LGKLPISAAVKVENQQRESRGKMMVGNEPGETKEPSQGVFFQLRKLVKELVEKIENLKPAHRV
jgi:hypothetical protein